MLQSCDELGRVAEEVLDSLRRATGSQSLQLHEIESELQALCVDFGGFDWDRQRQTLSVVVGPVELEGIRLGRFEIILQCDRLTERRPYEVIAVTPSPAAVDYQVTHPHVRGNMLCEGEGSAPIRLALDQGRLCDFFELVTRVLETEAKPQAEGLSAADLESDRTGHAEVRAASLGQTDVSPRLP